jgi:uncharacterized protein YdaU (DUF1376 family)
VKVRRPWFKFYASEWLSNRRVALMSPACKGVYIDLLAMCWQEGSIPADPVELAFLLRLTKREFFPLWDVVKTHFSTASDPNFLTNSRIESERAIANEKSQNGRNAANTRWADDADALQTHSERNASEEEVRKEKREKEEANACAFDFEAIYLAYPGKTGKAKGLEALRKAIKSQHQYELVLKAAVAYSDEEKHFKASGSKAFRPEVPYFSTWVNQRRWEDGKGATAQPLLALSPAQQLAEQARRRREADFEGQP